MLQGFRASPRHLRRRAAAAAAARLEEAKPVVEVHHQSEQEISVRKRRIKKNSRVQPEFYHSVQGASTRRPVSREVSFITMLNTVSKGVVILLVLKNYQVNLKYLRSWYPQHAAVCTHVSSSKECGFTGSPGAGSC